MSAALQSLHAVFKGLHQLHSRPTYHRQMPMEDLYPCYKPEYNQHGIQWNGTALQQDPEPPGIVQEMHLMSMFQTKLYC